MSISTTVTNQTQNILNTTYQSASNSCTANCVNIQQGQVIVLNNTTAGNITFTQQCTADASCYMTNALDAAVANYQKLNTTVGASPAFFPGLQVNTTVASTTQDITNQLTQVMNNLCNGAVSNAQIGQIIYATDSTLQNISFVQNGSAQADCVMENTARLQLQNQQVGDLTAKSGSQNSLIAAIVAAVVILIVIVVVSRVLKKNTSEKTDETKAKPPVVPPKPVSKPPATGENAPRARPAAPAGANAARGRTRF